MAIEALRSRRAGRRIMQMALYELTGDSQLAKDMINQVNGVSVTCRLIWCNDKLRVKKIKEVKK